MGYFIDALKNYAVFSGRATRKQYWMYILFYIIFDIVAILLDGALGMALFTIILTLGLIIPTISISARRLHDIGRTGWWQLIGIIPFGILVLIVFYCLDSQPQNKYGPNPKDVALAEAPTEVV